MNAMKIKVVIGLLTIAWLFHLFRLVFKVAVIVGGWSVPLYFSIVALIIIGAFIIWLIKG